MARLQFVLNRFAPDPSAPPLTVRGRRITEVVATVDADLTDADYVVRILLFSDGHTHPLADVPFTMGAGRWVWLPSDDPDDSGPQPSVCSDSSCLAYVGKSPQAADPPGRSSRKQLERGLDVGADELGGSPSV